VDPIWVSPALANTIGLVANEFTANTVKHGLDDRTDGMIGFRCAEKDGMLTFSCTNNLQERQKVEASEPGIGARLMRASIEKFGGTLVQNGSPTGFGLIATFPMGKI
jgi:two-component sensor histidine kinase